MSSLFRDTLTISGFVLATMLAIEYMNVLTRGHWQLLLTGRYWRQYLVAATLGAIPGCLGPFAVVAMYTHGFVTRGALVGAMVATSGDEAFVFLALSPGWAIRLMALLWVIGILSAVAVDQWFRPASALTKGHFELHHLDECECLPSGRLWEQWRNCIPARGILATVLGSLIIAVLAGFVGPEQWNWERVSLLLVEGFALFVVATTPDHFLEQHLWAHVVLRHAPRLFFWTVLALAAVHWFVHDMEWHELVRSNPQAMLLLACLVGLIPESGPHLLFISLFLEKAIPFSVLLANSIVQDGHGMLPLLAHSRKEFVAVKLINLACGLLIGAAAMALGF